MTRGYGGGGGVKLSRSMGPYIEEVGDCSAAATAFGGLGGVGVGGGAFWSSAAWRLFSWTRASGVALGPAVGSALGGDGGLGVGDGVDGGGGDGGLMAEKLEFC